MFRSKRSRDRKKLTLSRIIDWLFYVLYIVLFIVTILDLCNIPIPFVDTFTKNNDTLLKFLLLLFASVGIIVLNDKRELTKNVVNPLERVEELISAGNLDNFNFVFFKDKDDFYFYFTREIKSIENGAEVLVTSFEKNQGLNYYEGENKHIEAFMDDWSAKISSNSISVRQLVHVFTKKEVEEVKERIDKYKNCYNFALSAMVGMPIRPFIDFAIVNKTTVLITFPNDTSSPYEESFGMAIRSTEFASEFERYFNIYWNDDGIIIKNRDGVNINNLKRLESLALNISHFTEHKEYNVLLMQLISNAALYKNLKPLISDLHSLSNISAHGLPQKLAEEKIRKAYEDVHNKILSTAIPIKEADVQAYMSTSIASAQQQIRATSVEIGDASYWTSKDGESIFSLNTRGITDKGISVERIFIMNSTQEQVLSETLKRQRAAGVNVSVITTEMTARGSFEDFIIIDDKMVIQILTSGDAKMYIQKEKIDEYKRKFNVYKGQAL